MNTSDKKPTRGATVASPIDSLPTNFSQIYTYLHPVLVSTTFLIRFSATVADPLSSLTTLAGATLIFQILYAVVCLPPSSEVRPRISQLSPKSTQQQRKKSSTTKTTTSASDRIIPAILSALLSLLLGTPLLTVLLVLHGAPLTTHHRHTILTGVHLSLLATTPLFYAHGVASDRWRDLVSLTAPVDEVLGAAMGALLGAWVGAVPIPLDWDREWQKWPVTVVAGAYGGWAIGKLMGGTICRGWRVRWDERDVPSSTGEKDRKTT